MRTMRVSAQAANLRQNLVEKTSRKESFKNFHTTKKLDVLQLKMPSLSPTMSEGTIVKWLKSEGEEVQAGDVVCDIQTDKAVVSMEVDDEGILAKIVKSADTGTIQVGELIALVAEDGEDWKEVASRDLPSTSAVEKDESAATAAEPSSATATPPTDQHPAIGPASALLLTQYGIDSSQVTGTGPKGNIVKADVLNYIAAKNLSVVPAAAPATPLPVAAAAPTVVKRRPAAGFTDHEMSNMRRVIAKRLTESKQIAPHGYSSATANIDAISRLRQEFIRSGFKVSINDFVIKAVATALMYVPDLNVNIVQDEPVIQPSIDISVAVATDAGLITPIVKGAGGKSIQQISAEVKELAGRARQNKLKLDEFQGGTFTISNLGMFGISEFTAIINSPQAAILAVGGGTPTLDTSTGKPFTAMTSTLSFDRRFIDEALACDFMTVLKTILERPELLGVGYLPSVKVDREAAAIP